MLYTTIAALIVFILAFLNLIEYFLRLRNDKVSRRYVIATMVLTCLGTVSMAYLAITSASLIIKSYVAGL